MRAMKAVLISTYELGRQPFGLASPAAWLRRAGAEVACFDVSRQPLEEEAVRAADLIAFYVPMHTATRLAEPVIERIRQLDTGIHLCCYGLYAPLNEEWLRERGVRFVLGGEFEEGLVDVARRVAEHEDDRAAAPPASDSIPRLAFIEPDRAGLPPLARYATLQMPDGSRRVAGATEASRGERPAGAG